MSVFSATARGDLVALSKEVQARERAIRTKAKRLVGGSNQPKGQKKTEDKSENQEGDNSPQRDEYRDTFGARED